MNTTGINRPWPTDTVVGGTAKVIVFAGRSRSPAAATRPVTDVIAKLERAMFGLNETLVLYKEAAMALGPSGESLDQYIGELALYIRTLEDNLEKLKIMSGILK